MAKKAELLAEAKKLKLEVTEKNTISEIEAALAAAPKKEDAQKEVQTEKVETAKAGKRSAKAVAEVEEKEAKEERKAQAKEESSEEKPKIIAKPARSKLERKGKKFRKAAEAIEKGKVYTLKEAIALAINTSTTKFDATVEVHARLGVDPRQADQNIRDMVVLPAGTGKTVKIAVFADVEDAAKAKAAGADIAGSEEFLQQLDKGVINFDILISTPMMMAKLGKYAKVLGPKGLMPNPKSGTVTTDVVKAISDAKAGRVEFRVDSTGIVHLGVGKVSFGTDKILTNIKAVFSSLKAAKPSSIKGNYVKSLYITTSMGPSVQIENSELN